MINSEEDKKKIYIEHGHYTRASERFDSTCTIATVFQDVNTCMNIHNVVFFVFPSVHSP